MTKSPDIQKLLSRYAKESGFKAIAVDNRGYPLEPGRSSISKSRTAWRRILLQEALRWGEPAVMTDDRGMAGWGLPLMINSRMTGGLIVEHIPLDEGDPALSSKKIRAACALLQSMAEEGNLTNADYLGCRREQTLREKEKAEAIHVVKSRLYDDIRDLYLREEPALLASIKRGERPAAREIINRILVGIYHTARSRPGLLKSLALELVVIMSRAAVECGADPAEVLGCNFESATKLAGLTDDEEVSRWLTGMLERVMDAIRDNRQFPNAVLLSRAVAHMEEHLAEPLDRDTVARAAGLSGSHFSHLMREKTGSTFTDLLTRFRVDRAKTLLLRTNAGISQIALECGFGDQSYFTRVFKRLTGKTPLAYRSGCDWNNARKSQIFARD